MLSLSVRSSNNYIQGLALFTKSSKERLKFVSCFHVDYNELKQLIKKNSDVLLSLSSDEILIDSFDIPNIQNEGSKIALLKSKLMGLNKEEKKRYSLVYFENKDVAVPPKINYSVYAVKESHFDDVLHFNDNELENTRMLTLDIFSIMAISNLCDESSYIFHIYADEDRLLIVFSVGKNIKYSRTVYLPETLYISGNATDFFYENINLTYLYVRQTYSGESMKVLVTGSINNNTPLIELIESFSGYKITEINIDKIIQNISIKDFNEYLIPIGTLLLDNKCDFSKPQQVNGRIFRKVVKYVNVALIPILLLVAVFFFNSLASFMDKSEEMQRRSIKLFNSEIALVKEIGSANKLSYDYTYVDLIRKKTDTSLLFLKPIEDILSFQKFSIVTFEGEGKDLKVILSVDKPQENYINVEEYSKDMSKYIEEARGRGLLIDDKSLHTLKSMKNQLKLTITPDLQRR